jgi:hypothetical protein
MPPDATYQDVHAEFSVTRRTELLFGNGFSRALDDCFAYEDLFQAADFGDMDTTVRRLFQVLDTADFEHVVRGILECGRLCTILADEVPAARFDRCAETVRDSLRDALVSNHIPTSDHVVADKYSSCRSWLSTFERCFTINFDLLPYWVGARSRELHYSQQLRDGFGVHDFYSSLRVHPSSNTGRQNLFYLHGAMHLFRRDQLTEKIYYATGGAVRDQIAERINDGKFPLVVIGGETAQKIDAIGSSPYLSHCFRCFCKKPTALVTFGVKFGTQDQHLVSRIRQSNTLEKVYLGVYSDEDMISAAGTKATIEQPRENRQIIDVVLYDASTFNPWDPEHTGALDL